MYLKVFLSVTLLHYSIAIEFEQHFKNCDYNKPDFDNCVQKGLNRIQSYFKIGLPKYGIPSFDPFFAKEITVSRGISKLGFILTLRNVTETGWSNSKVTNFVSDLKNYEIVYTQSFPEKMLIGDYDFKGTLFNYSTTNKGKFTLTLYDLMQTTTVTKLPGQKLKAQFHVHTIKNLKLQVTNLLHGRQFLEDVLDKIINNTWQLGFVITRGLINELVSTAFTEIFDNAFRNFPFEKIFNQNLN